MCQLGKSAAQPVCIQHPLFDLFSAPPSRCSPIGPPLIPVRLSAQGSAVTKWTAFPCLAQTTLLTFGQKSVGPITPFVLLENGACTVVADGVASESQNFRSPLTGLE